MRRFNLAGELVQDPDLSRQFTGACVRAWRESTGLSRARLAAILGCYESTVQRWEASAVVAPRVVFQLAGTERLVRRLNYQRREAKHSRDYRRRRDVCEDRIKRGLKSEPEVPLW